MNPLNCPYCTDAGNHPEVNGNDLSAYWVDCECGACGPIKATAAKAVEAWNAVSRIVEQQPLLEADLDNSHQYQMGIQSMLGLDADCFLPGVVMTIIQELTAKEAKS